MAAALWSLAALAALASKPFGRLLKQALKS